MTAEMVSSDFCFFILKVKTFLAAVQREQKGDITVMASCDHPPSDLSFSHF